MPHLPIPNCLQRLLGASWWAFLFLLALWVAAYSLYVYGFLPLGNAVGPAMRESFRANATAVYLHVFAAAFAPTIGLWQLCSRWRRRWPRLHRWLGHAYLVGGVGVGGLAGLWLGWHSHAQPVTRLAFVLLAIAWLATGAAGYARIRRGDVAGHREWMWRNYALTWGAVMLRLQMALLLGLGLPVEEAYAIVAWLAWVPNLAVAEWLVRRHRA